MALPPPTASRPDGAPPPLPPYAAYPTALSGAVRYRPGPAPGLVYAGFWVRLLASLIDVVPLGVVTALFHAPSFTGSCVTLSSNTVCSAQVTGAGATLVTAILGVYWVLTWSVLGGSPGQRALGLRVVKAADGQRIGVARALVRFVAYLVAAIPFAVGLIWAAFDAQKQGWHDKVAGTFVVGKA